LSSPPYGERRSPSSKFLPPDPGVSAPHRLTPGLALRVGVLGGITTLVFVVLFVRLWSLQVLSGDRYLAAAQDNQLRTIRIEAPRGTIVDRNGVVMVDNVAGTAVKLWVGDLPDEGRFEVITRLADVLDVPAGRLAREVDERLYDPLNPITVKTAVSPQQVAYLWERQAEFPGVKIQQTYLRSYPYGARGAQLLGYTGEISPSELKLADRRIYRAGDKIGKSGVEARFDAYLRGTAGQAQIRVDSLGTPRSAVEPKLASRPGSTVRLTIDVGLQRAAERALQYGIAKAIETEAYYANGGAIVALDPQDGAVLAMASWPTFKPSVYVGRVDPQELEPLLDANAAKVANYPGFNRVTQVAYPPGSIWKPVTALAAMQEHLLEPYQSIQCTPTATYGLDNFAFKNWDPYVNKPMALPEALARSCDTYFYDVGYRFYLGGDDGRSRMQEWARRFGFGAPTGLEIGNESRDTIVPTPEWKKTYFTSDWDRAWNPGDSIQLAIGQQDVTVTPLQMARFYAMLANGGKLVTPYVVQSVEAPGARGRSVVLRRFAPDPPLDANVDPGALQVVRDGLYQATHFDYGTSSGVFASFPIAIAGKTGTAEKVVPIPGYPADHKEDQSWWCGYGPAQTEQARIVVCAVIENGGHGSTAAAPAALKVFEKFFGVKGGTETLVETD